MARTIAYSSEAVWKALPPMLEEVPIKPVSLVADNGYSAGQLRQTLKDLGITAYIPLHPNQNSTKAARGEFVHRGDRLLCSQGKILRPGTSRSRSQNYKHLALQKDRQACPLKAECPPPRVSSTQRKTALRDVEHVLPQVPRGRPMRFALTGGQAADAPQAIPLLTGIETAYVIAGKGYESNKMLAFIQSTGATAVIPSKSNRRDPWEYGRELYRKRNLIERAFNKLKL